MALTNKSREFNDLLDAEIAVRDEKIQDEYTTGHYLMEDLGGRKPFVLANGKTVTPVHSSGGPGSETSKWLIVVEYEGTMFMADTHFDSYDLQELAVFREAESYVEPVTKYRAVR